MARAPVELATQQGRFTRAPNWPGCNVQQESSSNSPQSQVAEACGLVTRGTQAAADGSDRRLRRLDTGAVR